MWIVPVVLLIAVGLLIPFLLVSILEVLGWVLVVALGFLAGGAAFMVLALADASLLEATIGGGAVWAITTFLLVRKVLSFVGGTGDMPRYGSPAYLRWANRTGEYSDDEEDTQN